MCVCIYMCVCVCVCVSVCVKLRDEDTEEEKTVGPQQKCVYPWRYMLSKAPLAWIMLRAFSFSSSTSISVLLKRRLLEEMSGVEISCQFSLPLVDKRQTYFWHWTLWSCVVLRCRPPTPCLSNRPLEILASVEASVSIKGTINQWEGLLYFPILSIHL